MPSRTRELTEPEPSLRAWPGALPDLVAVGPQVDVSLDAGHRLRNGLIAVFLLAAVAAALLLSVPGLQSISHEIGNIDERWLTVAVLLELASCAGYALAFQFVFDRLPRRLSTRIALAEMGFGAVVPAGGAGGIAIGAWIAKAKGGSLRWFMERSAVLFLLTSAINAMTLALVGLLTGVGVWTVPHPLLLALVPAAIAVASVVAFLAVPSAAARLEATGDQRRGVRWLQTTARIVRDTERELRESRLRLLGAMAYLWCDIAVLWACFRAFDATPSLGALVLAYQIGYLTNVIPVPGGIGVLDGGIVAALLLYGISATTASAAVIVYHALALWIPTVLGTGAFLRLRSTLHDPELASQAGPVAGFPAGHRPRRPTPFSSRRRPAAERLQGPPPGFG